MSFYTGDGREPPRVCSVTLEQLVDYFERGETSHQMERVGHHLRGRCPQCIERTQALRHILKELA